MTRFLTFAFLFSYFSLSHASPHFEDGLQLHVLEKEDLKRDLDQVAALRITVFREYPYLYDGTLEYEKEYLNQYADSEGSILVVAKDGNRVVGCITGVPLNEAFEDCQKCFLEQNIPMERVFYLGEIVLLKEYRGQGLGARMYEAFEQCVKKMELFEEIAFSEIVLPMNDPRRPLDYFNLDQFWYRRNFDKCEYLTTDFTWKELGSSRESPHKMVFWAKDLHADR